MDTGINPMRRLREERGVSRRDFAQLLGMSYNSLVTLEVGNLVRLPEPWRPRLEALGVNFDELAAAYAAWREAQAEAAAARLEAGVARG